MNKENKDVSSANNLHLLLISFDKSLTYTKNNKSPKMDTCSAPAITSTQYENRLFKTILCFLFPRTSSKILIMSPQIPF